jgi:hypothetical protein
MKRWYDAFPKLSRQFESFKHMHPHTRDKLIADIMGMVKSVKPGLLEEFLMDFPLDLNRRRWYDRDPYLWLMINGLKYAPVDLLRQVEAYLQTHNPVPVSDKEESVVSRK